MSSVNVETKVENRVDAFRGIAAVTYNSGAADGGRTVESPIFETKEGADEWCKSLIAGEVVSCQFDAADPKAQDTFQLEAFKSGLDAQNPEEQGGEEEPVEALAPEAPSDTEQKAE